MASERSTLSKNRKIEKSFEDLLTGLSDESDDDIDDLVNFDHLPEMCSDSTLIAMEKTNKAYTNASLDNSLKMSDFGQDTDLMKPSKPKEEKNSLFDDDDILSAKPNSTETSKNNGKLIDFDFDVETDATEAEQGRSSVDDLLNLESNQMDSAMNSEKLILDIDETETNDFDENEEEENSTESSDVEDQEEDKYVPSFEDKTDIELMVTDESGKAIDMDQDNEVTNGLQKEDSIDLDAIVQDNAHLDVGIGKQKTALRKRGSLAKRRKPTRNCLHSKEDSNDDSLFTDSTEPKPMLQNGHDGEEDVFDRDSGSHDSDASSPPAKKPLPGMVALPGMGMPLQPKKSKGSTPSDSDLTPDDTKKDFRTIGVKLPVPTSRGNSQSDNQDISTTRLQKTSERESVKVKEESSHQFEKPQLKAVSRPNRDKIESDNSKFDMPALKQVERTPSKSKSSDRMDSDSKHMFQTPKLRKVEDLPTESLRFVQGKTGDSDDIDESKNRTDDSRHTFQTPKLKKVDNLPTQTLRHLRNDESNDTEMTLDLGELGGESSTDDHTGSFFDKPQLRNVPKPTERQRSIERAKIDVPELKNVPKTESELKSPIESEKVFSVPQLKSVQKEKDVDNQDQETGTFQIPTLRATPLPKRREPPKSPEAKTFDVPALRRTPRIKQDTDGQDLDKPSVGLFEKPKLKSARSLHQEVDDSSSKESKHRFDKPMLRNTPSKSDTSVQRSESGNKEKPSWLQERKLKPMREQSVELSGSREKEKPSWLNDSKVQPDAKENRISDNETLENVPRKSSIPLQETQQENINGHASRTRYTSTGSDNSGDDLKIKKNTGRDQYTPSWLKTTETRGKSPSTPNLAFCTPSKDTGEIPQWKKELAEKRKGRKDSDLRFTPKKDASGDKELPPWKVELGQKKMRQTPAKVQEPKVKTSEPEWKKAAEEKRQRLRSSGLLASVKSSK